VPDVGTLIINEQIPLARSREITVRALHLIRPTGEHFLFATARAGMVCVVAVEPSRWQTIKRLYRN